MACNSTSECDSDESCINGVCQPGGNPTDAAVSDRHPLDAPVPDRARRDVDQPDLTSIDLVAPDRWQSDRLQSDLASTDRWQADRAQSDTRQDDRPPSDSRQPDTSTWDAHCQPVAGGWSSWSYGTWTDDGSCGTYAACKQRQSRTNSRTCTNPTPTCGGADCVGSDTQTETQEIDCGLVNGGWTAWSYGTWSDDGTCGTYTACKQRQSRIGTRSCTNPAPACGGANCVGSTSQTDTRDLDCGAIAGDWTAWGPCSAPCGGTQTRTCTNPAPECGGADCVGAASQACENPSDCGGGDDPLWFCNAGSCECGGIQCTTYCWDGECCTADDCGGAPDWRCLGHMCEFFGP